MGTIVNEGLANRNSIRLSLGKSVRWVNDELGWEIGRVVLADGKHLVDGYFGGMRTHYLVQGYHGGLFFVKDSVLEDAPSRDTYEDKDGNPLGVKKPSEYPNGHQRIMESSAAYEKAKQELHDTQNIKLATWPLLEAFINENKAAAERTIPPWVVEEYNKRHTPPNDKAEEYSKEHKRARQACNSVEQAATLDCRKGKSIQFDEELSYKM